MRGLGFLLRRELQATMPTAFFIIAVAVTWAASEARDSGGWSASTEEGLLIFETLVWFYAGLFLGRRDERQGTTVFFDALPVERSTRLGVRFAAAHLTLAAAATVVFVVSPPTPALALASIFVIWAAALSVGIAMAPLGVLGGATPLLNPIVSALVFNYAPAWSRFLPLDLARTIVVGNKVGPSPSVLLFWAVLSPLSLVFALLLDRRRGRPTQRARLSLRWLLVLAGAAVCFFTCDRIRHLPARPIVVTTRHFEFTLPADMHVPDAAQLAQFDADVDTMASWFGVTLTERLRADGTQTLRNCHGKAQGRLIALDVSDGLTRETVAHEAAHVLAALASNGAFNEAAAFETLAEGLSSYVEFRLGAQAAEQRDRLYGKLVAVARRGQLDERAFVDADAARALGSRIFPYSTGDAVQVALVELYGDDAPFRVVRAAEAAVKTGLRGDALRDDLFGRVGFWWTPVLARARALIDEAITRRDNASSSTTPSGTSSTTSTVSPDEPRLRQDRSSPLPTASVVTGALVVSAVRPDGSSFPAGDSIDCAVRNVVDDADHFDVIPRCTVPLDELAGTWAEVRVRIAARTWSPWLRIALPDRWTR